MLVVDDLLLAPARGLLWVFQKIHDAAQEEVASEADAITTELRELYMMLETGEITEAEFGDKEGTLLDRLEAIRERASERDKEDVDEEDEGNEEQDDDEEGAEKESQ